MAGQIFEQKVFDALYTFTEFKYILPKKEPAMVYLHGNS